MHPDLSLEKWIEVHDQSLSADDRYKSSKQIRFKTSMLRSDLCDFSDAYIVVKGTIIVAGQMVQIMRRNWLLKIMLHSLLEFQKLIIHLLTMQRTYTL